MCEAVVRCPVHAASPLDLETPQQPQSSRPTNHLIRADHPHAEYVDADPQYGRQSVSVPFEAPAVGTQWSTVLYRYMCNSSCAGELIKRLRKMSQISELGSEVVKPGSIMLYGTHAFV